LRKNLTLTLEENENIKIENLNLKSKNLQLESENSELKSQIVAINQKIENEIKKLKPTIEAQIFDKFLSMQILLNQQK
jgi:D-hexose-6-phosphate mutarotase